MSPNETIVTTINNNSPEWKVHTSRLLIEIVQSTNQPILKHPLNIFGKILAKVGERAAEINDLQLNALMCRLTIYTIADPYSSYYDPKAVEEIIRAADRERKMKVE